MYRCSTVSRERFSLCWFTTADFYCVYSAPSPTTIPDPGEEQYSQSTGSTRGWAFCSLRIAALCQLWVSALIITPVLLYQGLGYQLIDGDNDNSPGVHLILSLAQ